MAELQGSWRAESATRNGEPADDVSEHLLTFHDEEFEIRSRGGECLYRGTYTVRSDESPAQIDFEQAGEVLEGTTWKGIYSRNGRQLIVCDNAPDPNKPRPTQFQAPPDSDYVLIVFERVEN